ncbi:2-dehydropantoate 2-reductase [Catellatospora methionotrophica]|uniref:2-dehydropantoate 2-reductase n=1 Tax=Catellatospora methionotrophica TaxID=121620 RepID=A0A8J3LBQ0_9ACTN|nr:2-dehydropantoate 2-reductase N-terminal domain-containing protein [Catellatospora methionotrophica]GIG11680.1 2-dehydropantoate 2-reductase [Catellatospora methionotrophica]
MRMIVYGAGAVGGVLGAYLHLSGQPVVLIARGEHLAAIREHGLTLQDGTGSRTVDVPVAAGPAEIAWQDGDVVLLAVKGEDTEAALRELAACAPATTPVVCLQNGVDNERRALRAFEHVYGVCVMSPTSHLTPGVVRADCHPVPGLLDIGRFPSGTDTTAESIAAAFRAAGYGSEPRPDIMRWKYGKLLRSVGNAVDAVCERADGFGEIAAQARAEAVAVLDAAGIAYTPKDEDDARRADILKPAFTGARGGGSSWQSLARGTGHIEADQLSGEIVLLARLHGLPAPYNENARRWANRFAREGRAPASLAPADWLATLGG